MQKGIGHILLLLGIVIAVAALGLNLIINQGKQDILHDNPRSITNTPIPIVNSLPTRALTPTTTPNAFETYTSEKLGISFHYAPHYLDLKLKIEEQGNKVFVGSSDYLIQFVEVIETESGLSVEEDIKKRYLTGFPAYCELDTKPTNTESLKSTNPNFKIVRITIDRESMTLDDYANAMSYCPRETTTTAVNYFAYDTTYPDKYIYYSIGHESPWPANSTSYEKGGDDINWMQTIEFVD